MLKSLSLISLLGIVSFCVAQVTVPSYLYSCPTNFVLNPLTNRCHNFTKSPKLPWADARQSCIDMGGYLAVIDDVVENEYLTGEMGITFWISLNDNNESTVFSHTPETGYESVPYLNWKSNEPRDKYWYKVTNCTQVNSDGLWRARYCPYKRGYVCEANSTTSVQCPPGWESNPNDTTIEACYLFNQTATNFADALSNCNATGGFLYFPTSEAENIYVTDLESPEPYYIGHTDIENEGTFLTSTNTSTSYTNFNWPEPNNGGLFVQADCVIVYSVFLLKYFHNDVQCENTYTYVCKWEVVGEVFIRSLQK